MTRCNFCGKIINESLKCVQGISDSFICELCVEACTKIIKTAKNNDKTENYELPKPKEIKRFLDEHIIGQEHAKKTLSVAVYNHYKRNNSDDNDGVEIQKSNILLLGPTGTGKTFLAQTIAKMLNVPFAIADATTLTEAGYVGEDVENVLLKLIQNADYDIKEAERGIIYIDEIDKISRKSENTSITRDVSGEGVQQALLKIIEGTIASVPPQGGRKHPHQEFFQIDTSKILFICGGAFDGIEKIINSRSSPKKNIGFGGEILNKSDLKKDNLSKIMSSDIVRFGLIPEFVGRFPIITTLSNLDVDDLKNIITKPQNSLLKQYKKLLKMDGVNLEFSDDVIELIAEKAIEQNTGARGLRSIIEEIMNDIMYEVPDSNIRKILITKDVIEGNISVFEKKEKLA